MTKKLPLVVLAIISFFGLAQAQNVIPNASFDNWTPQGGYQEPDDWGTINSLTSFVGGTALKATAAADIHSGTAALKLVSKDFTIAIAPGICATGQINQATQAVDGGLAYNLRPVSISGWFKYSPGVGDTGSVSVSFTKWNGTSRDVVGFTQLNFSATVGTYTHFVDTIEYDMVDAPDTAVIILLSSAGENGVENSTLFIDDLAFDFDNTGIANQNQNLKVGVGPNPAQNRLFVSNLKTEAIMELFDITGRAVATYSVSEHKKDADISAFANGTYIYRISDNQQNILSSGKLIIKR